MSSSSNERDGLVLSNLHVLTEAFPRIRWVLRQGFLVYKFIDIPFCLYKAFSTILFPVFRAVDVNPGAEDVDPAVAVVEEYLRRISRTGPRSIRCTPLLESSVDVADM